jgi:tetratricopeptide (TPR) repeat protein
LLFAGVVTSALAMTTKESGAALPLILVLFDYFFLSDNWRDVWRKRGWFHAGVLATVALVAVNIYQARVLEVSHSVGFGIKGISSWEYLRSQPAVLLRYARVILWPDLLVLDYGWQVETSPWRIYGLGLIVLIALLVSVLAMARGSRLGFLGFTVFLLLAPTSSFVPIIDLAFEHRVYLSLAPLAVLFVLGLHALACRWTDDALQQRALVAGIVVALAVPLSVRTALRSRDYLDISRVLQQCLAFNSANPRAMINLGRERVAKKEYRHALDLYFEALKYDHRKPPYWHIAHVYAHQKQYEEAYRWFDKAIELHPKKRAVRLSYANALIADQQFARAAQMLRDAIATSPNLKDDTAIELKSRLAWLLSVCPDEKVRNGTEAIALAQEVRKMVPQEEPKWLDLLAAAYAEAADFDAAVKTEDEAIQLARRQMKSTASLEARRTQYEERMPRRMDPALFEQEDQAAPQERGGDF